MAFSLSLFTLILLVFITLFCNTTSADSKKSSAFDFLKNLQGCHKGQKVKGIEDFKKYLHQFGYLNSDQNQYVANDDIFDDQLESALKTYQLNFHLKPTGILDSETLSKMMTPRCGVADIINGETRMESGKKSHIVPEYAFFPRKSKWPANKYHLTYGFVPGTPPEAIEPVKKAFGTWQANSQFTFERVEDYRISDLKIGFYRGDHGDGAPFDGPGGIVAHSAEPQNGLFHYDADENWTVGAKEGALDLETTALHEIGHLLGLAHSSVEAAIMYPYVQPGTTRGLNDDDIQGIKALYNL